MLIQFLTSVSSVLFWANNFCDAYVVPDRVVVKESHNSQKHLKLPLAATPLLLPNTYITLIIRSANELTTLLIAL